MSATPASPTGHGFSPRGGRGHGHHRLRKTVLTILGLAILGGLVFWIVVATSGGGGPSIPINPSTGKSSTSLSAGQTYVSNGVTIIVQGNASGVTVNVPNNGTEAGYDPITQADVTGWCKHAFPNDPHAAARLERRRPDSRLRGAVLAHRDLIGSLVEHSRHARGARLRPHHSGGLHGPVSGPPRCNFGRDQPL